jgi:capsular polysaccharide biosynthesis protein
LEVSGDVTFLGTQGYYHWLIEDLPAFLQAIEEVPNARVVVRQRSPQFVLDALEIMGITPLEVPVSVKIRSFVFASRSTALYPNSIDVLTLRKFREKVCAEPLQGGRQIYVSRKLSGRTPTNESEVEALFLSFGFEIVCLEVIGFQEQIRMFAGANVVAGTHGAGLANVVWCPEGSAHLVEISKDDFPKCFAALAQVARVDYTEVLSSSTDEWTVDLTQLELVLRQITRNEATS